MKSYEFFIESYMRFLVITRCIEKGKPQIREHIVSRVKKEWHCDCLGYKYSNPNAKTCRHIKFIKDAMINHPKLFQLTEREFDWTELEKMARRFG